MALPPPAGSYPYSPPPPAGSWTPANANHGKPRYATAGDWAGGLRGADPGRPDVAAIGVSSTANVALARSGGGANEADYAPRTQNAKLLAGQVATVDIGRERGAIAPNQRYPDANDAAVAAPVVSSIAPATAPAGSITPVAVIITGTGFTAWSRVFQGGVKTPDPSLVYISATQLSIMVYPSIAVVGTAAIVVEDHGVLSNADKVFTFT